MGKRLRRIQRGLPTIGKESTWKEDLLALTHIVKVLGFTGSQIRAQVARATKAGHFTPGVVVSGGKLVSAFELDDVPGTQADAQRSWREFQDRVPTEQYGEIFRASRIADPSLVERLCDTLEADGIAIPAKAQPPADYPPSLVRA